MSDKLRVFIGSSKEALNVAYAVKAVLDHNTEVEARVWSDDLFRPSTYPLDELLRFTTDFDFAIFVWAGDDKSTIRDVDVFVPRDNVVLEAGMFYSAIGKERVFILAPQEPNVKSPSDLLGLIPTFYITPSDGNIASAVAVPVRNIAAQMTQRGKFIRRDAISIVCHGTKFNVPDRNEFWNNLLRNATRRFYLVGRTNQSWIDKGEDQAIDLSRAAMRIIKSGGKVRIFSYNQPEIIDTHYYFFKTYLRACLDEENEEDKKQVLKYIENQLIYATYPHSNYGAIVSDDRLMLLPTMNSANFRNESLVLEIQDANSQQFKNYIADLDRLLKSKDCKRVNVSKLLTEEISTT